MRIFVLTTYNEWFEIDIDDDNYFNGFIRHHESVDLRRLQERGLSSKNKSALERLLNRPILSVYILKDFIRTVHDIYDRTPEPAPKRQRSIRVYDGKKKGKKKMKDGRRSKVRSIKKKSDSGGGRRYRGVSGDGEEEKSKRKKISPRKRKGKGKGDGLNVKSAVLKGMRLQTQLNKLGIPDNPIVPSMAPSFSSSTSPVTSIISLPSTISSLSTSLSTSLPTSLRTPQILLP